MCEGDQKIVLEAESELNPEIQEDELEEEEQEAGDMSMYTQPPNDQNISSDVTLARKFRLKYNARRQRTRRGREGEKRADEEQEEPEAEQATQRRNNDEQRAESDNDQPDLSAFEADYPSSFTTQNKPTKPPEPRQPTTAPSHPLQRLNPLLPTNPPTNSSLDENALLSFYLAIQLSNPRTHSPDRVTRAKATITNFRDLMEKVSASSRRYDERAVWRLRGGDWGNAIFAAREVLRESGVEMEGWEGEDFLGVG